MQHQENTKHEVSQDLFCERRELDTIGLCYEVIGKWKCIILIALIGALLGMGVGAVKNMDAFISQNVSSSSGISLEEQDLPSPLILTHQATAQVYVQSVLPDEQPEQARYLMNDYIQLVNIREVREQVCSNVSLCYTDEQLCQMIKITVPVDSHVLNIAVSAPTEQEAVLLASEYPKVAKDYAEKVIKVQSSVVISSPTEAIEIKPIIIGEQEPTPKNPLIPLSSLLLFTVIGAFLGGFFSALFFGIRFITSDALRKVDDVTHYTGLSVLTVIPMNKQEKILPKTRERGKNQ